MTRRELAWSRLAITATLLAVSGALVYYARLFSHTGVIVQVEIACLAVLGVLLLYGNLVYQFSRLGALKREAAHHPVNYKILERIHGDPAPRLAILIPSYCEEPHVLRQTVISAALVEYPSREVVVLIDDPPNDRASRAASWGVIREINELLAQPALMLKSERDAFLARKSANSLDTREEAANLASIYRRLAEWLEMLSEHLSRESISKFAHVDKFFIDRILLAPATSHRSRAITILASPLPPTDLDQEYMRLTSLIASEVSGFERKQFANLSHAPNKAMNLNAYIGLIGKSFRKVKQREDTILVETEEAGADVTIAAADFLLTLDADSVVMPDYALKLAQVMRSDDRIAVAQTPYCAFPEAPTSLERIAGATTDIQHIAHQGSSTFNAAYWVGANALLRLLALQDIKSETRERGHLVPVFIQDRTVIEDTGSTIDLICRGWAVYNYPERLAYSATPPDFGALIIQRRRWSNGGLIILADLIRSSLVDRDYRPGASEALIRIHYLVSPAAWSFGALALLLLPFDPLIGSIWLPVVAAPYYFVYGRDLVRSGYNWKDLGRVYVLNLLLIPVNLVGVLGSLFQAITGRKAAFRRTPKVANRTAVPAFYTTFNVAMLGLASLGLGYALWRGEYSTAVFPVLNTIGYVYGLTFIIGRTAFEDVHRSLREKLRVPLLSRRYNVGLAVHKPRFLPES